MSDKSFEWFSLDSAVSPTTTTKAVALNGMNKVYGVLSNPSHSTEEFISGAISSLGQADRTIMYVNTTLNALSDRLSIAAKVAKPINAAKSRGMEGFDNVPYLNPWEYAVEGKVSEFFKKIWVAIRTIARKILEAIANFIKFIGNAIASLGTKAQAKDRDRYLRNKKTIDPKVKAAKVDSMEITSIAWKVDAAKIAEAITKVSAQYLKATKANAQDEAILNGVTRADLKTMTTEADFKKVFGAIFGITGVATAVGAVGGAINGTGGAFGAAKTKVSSFIASVNTQIEEGIKILGGTRSKSPKEVVGSAFTNGEKMGKVKIGDIVKLAGKDFGVLSNEWLSDNVTKVVATMRANEKAFTAYTKTIDAVAKKFDTVQSANHSNVASLSNLTSQLAKARCQLNSFYSGLILELTSYALRFRKTVHIALKAYLKVGYGSKVQKKGTESLNAQSIESMFSF